jgi:triacylglycerol lipase
MKLTFSLVILFFISFAISCNTKNTKPVPFLLANDVVQLNQLIYKDSIANRVTQLNKNYSIVWEPLAVKGNYAVVVKNNTSNQYCMIIRGSLIEFSKEGFNNWILQDFNIFNFQPWPYTDTMQKAFVSNGSFVGFNNLQQLKDVKTDNSLEDFLHKNISDNASLIITGHSLGGNLAQIYASYLWKNFSNSQRQQTKIITYGATAVGNAAFVTDLEEKFPTSERFEIDKDIAPKFPSMDKLSNISSLLGLDSALGLSNISGEKNVLTKAFDLISTGAKALNLLGTENTFTQSAKHKRLLKVIEKEPATSTKKDIIGLFDEGYKNHRIDKYAELLGVKIEDK